MLSFFTKEKLGVTFFLSLVFFTAFFLFKENLSEKYLGAITVLWSLFGFYRYSYLNGLSNIKLPKILTLPSRILFGLNRAKESQISNSIDGLLNINILLFFIFGLLFIFWGLYCTFYPSEISLIQLYWEGKKEVLQNINIEHQSYFIILKKISYYFIIILMVFIGVTYSNQKYFQGYFKLFFIPFFIVMIFSIIFFNSFFSISTYFDFSYLKGIGWGQFDIFKKLSPYEHTDLNSGFLKRYIETGLVGAYGLYIVFLPILLMVIKRAFAQEHRLHFTFIIILLLFSFALDFFWLWHPLIGSFQFLILAYMACSWKNVEVNRSIP